MGYSFDFESTLPALGEGMAMGVAGVLIAVLIVGMLVALAVGVAQYVFGALGLYRIAKRRGIHHPWLAWIPVGNAWLLGSVSDHYQYIVKRKVTKRRRLLLLLEIVVAALMMVYGTITILAGIAGNGLGMATAAALVYFLVACVAVATTVFCYISYFDLFRSSKPENAVLFLVLGILFNVTLPFFVFACGNSDKGMPAKRAPQSAPVVEEAPAEESAAETDSEEQQIPQVEAEPIEDWFEA